MSETALLTFDQDIATITLNRPEVHNAFNREMIAHLGDLCDTLAARDDVRAVVLRGAGKSFSAGADLNWMRDSVAFSKEENRDDARALADMLGKLNTLPQLTIAAVQGAAFGGGFGLGCCCDVVLASDKAVFALSEVKLGLIPATIGPYVVQAIGARQARRFFQTGERFGAAKALEIGLAHEVGTDLEALLATLLTEIGKNGAYAMRAAKKLCFDLSAAYVTEAVKEDTAERIAAIRTGAEAQQRLRDFLEK